MSIGLKREKDSNKSRKERILKRKMGQMQKAMLVYTVQPKKTRSGNCEKGGRRKSETDEPDIDYKKKS